MMILRHLLLTCVLICSFLLEAPAQLVKDAERLADNFNRPLGDTLVFSTRNSALLGAVRYRINDDPTINKLQRNKLPLTLGEYTFYNIDDSQINIRLIVGDQSYPVIAGDSLQLFNNPSEINWYNGKINRNTPLLPDVNNVVKVVNLGPDTLFYVQYFNRDMGPEPTDVDTFPLEAFIDLDRLSGRRESVRVISGSLLELTMHSFSDSVRLDRRFHLNFAKAQGKLFYSSTGEEMNVPKSSLEERLCSILRHTEFLDAARYEGMPYDEVFATFNRNPYFRRYLTDIEAPDLYSNSMRYWYPQCPILGDPALNWQQYLYTDSVLSVARRIDMGNLSNRWPNNASSVSQFAFISQQNDTRRKELESVFDQTALIVGLSDFIVERAQEELNITFMQRFRDYLETNPEVRTLFPATLQLFAQFDLANYRLMMSNAKPAFQNDLENLGISFAELLQLDDYKLLENSPEVFNLAMFFEIVNMTYHDISLDTVMLRTYQNVRFREDYLTREIARELGKAFAKDPIALNPLRDEVLTYAKSLQNLSDDLSRQTDQLLDELALMQNTLVPDLTGFEASFFNSRISDIAELLQSQRDLVEFRTDQKIPDTIPYYGSVRNLREYGLQIDQYFSGSANQTRLLQEAELKNYDQLFTDFPEQEELIAEGFFWSNQLLQDAFRQNLQGWQAQLQQLEIASRKLKEEIYVARANRMEKALNDFRIKKQTLELGLQSVINYYQYQKTETAGRSPVFARVESEVFALQYLLKVLQQRPDGLWKELEDITYSRAYPTDQSYQPAYYQLAKKLLAKGEETFSQIYERSLNRLASIQAIVATEGFPNNPVAKEKYLRQLARDADFLKSVNTRYTQFNLDKTLELSTAGMDYLDATFLTGVDSLYQGYRMDVRQLETAARDTTRNLTIIQQNELTDNLFFRQLETLVQNPAFWQADDFADLDSLQIQLQRLKKDIKTQAGTAQTIQTELQKLETAFAFKNSLARQSAHEVAKALELSVHLLHVFQNAPGDSLMLIVQDTSRISYTVKQFIGGSPFTERAWQVDTLRVNNRDTIWNETQVDRWLNLTAFDSLMTDEVRRNAFLGLVYQRLSSIEDLPGLNPKGVATLVTKAFESFYYLESARKELKSKQILGAKRSFDDYYPFLKSTVDLFNTAILTPVGDSSLVQQHPDLYLIPLLSKEGLAFYENLSREQYGGSVKNLVNLIRLIWEQTIEYQTDKKCRNNREKALDAIVLYGSFMAEILDAKTSDEVSTTLKKYTVAPGSSRTKRESKFSFSVNGYLGLTGGMEYLIGENNELDAAPYTAVAAPVGLTFSFGVFKQSALSLHASILDLGAVTSFRINSTGNGQPNLPELSFKNVLAPGMFVIYDIGKSPFSIGSGLQYGPQLREIMRNGNLVEEAAFRLNFFATVDVPLFQLYRRPRDSQQSNRIRFKPDEKKIKSEKRANKKVRKTYLN